MKVKETQYLTLSLSYLLLSKWHYYLSDCPKDWGRLAKSYSHKNIDKRYTGRIQKDPSLHVHNIQRMFFIPRLMQQECF